MLSPGDVFAGDFRILGLLGEGGFGAVYEAEQLSTGRRRALKLMHAEHQMDAELIERFVREARIGAAIDSEHVIEVVAAGVAPGAVPWIAMELLEGSTLRELVERNGPLSIGSLVEVFEQLCHGVDAAHRAGVVHRDLKPENVFLARHRGAGGGTRVKVLDFGIARWVATSQSGRNSQVLGSPKWMAPEQLVVGAPLGPPTDVWALGLIAFFALTGKSYWLEAQIEAGSIHRLMIEITTDPVELPSSRAARVRARAPWPEALDDWLTRCLERDTAERYPTVNAAFDALRSASAGTLASGASAPSAVAALSTVISPRTPTPARWTEEAKIERTVALAAPPSAVSAPQTPAPAPGITRARTRSRWPLLLGGAALLALLAGGAIVALLAAKRTGRRAVAAPALVSAQLGAPVAVVAPAQVEAAPDPCAAGDASACLAGAQAITGDGREDQARAAALNRRACDLGSGEGCNDLGIAYERGTGGLARDDRAAMTLYRRACDVGAAIGCANLGLMQRDGRGGLVADASRAAPLLQRGCDGGEAQACGDLAVLYENGTGVQQNDARAVELYGRACDGGAPTGCNDLAVLYQAGRAGPSFAAREAVPLFRRACDQGELLACSNLGTMYEDGSGGLAINEVAAAALHRRACDGGEAQGCRYLAGMYELGRGGLPLDRARAGALFRSACDQGDTRACEGMQRVSP